ncbi:DUF771 domain-containing protein [Staphylococcus kloosii]|uniref:DUF771 domain-containing protein n=1 Tax=Staphylococcus kloosii TaxID=29384 RepID=A0ABQ0XM62_9STAP|nr:DUF771 domain-containing protein [Staphylococcus kloosii]AVQ35766.1 DUF771 domain-containing protein [Staphylococcus kloosii]PNZ05460.1 DUF771 domain-containing protein [Staphylococcus kloosii]GEP82523.1 hypothetical protein SKL01_17010 [Staphylococcus kloosii]SUM48826.1 Uncharacterized protein conserved in bacteria [Staphylococcus kloosii]
MTQLTVTIPPEFVLITTDEHTQLLMNQQKAIWSKKDFVENSPFKSETTVNERILDKPRFRKILERENIASYPGNGRKNWCFDGPKAYEFLRKYRDEF